MNTAAFHSLQAAQSLRDAGLEQGPAEAIADLFFRLEDTYIPRNEIQAMQLAIENRIEQGTNAVLRRINAVLLTSLAVGGGLIAALVVT
ncbi:MAG: hypothetical protein OXQ86_02650 [Gammaproteobacteria bacterium]|nr:hypothetical protein [Gammaproteobacteria bacterium]MDE0412698.1 hypothetical protein [Gammaproteobacteria bacterium]